MDALSIGYDGTDGTKAGALLSCAGALHWGMQLANLGVPKRSDYMGRVPQISPEDITRNLGPDLFGPKCSETVGRSVLYVPLQWPCGVFLR
jgi:hypothetical protein